MSTQRIVCTTQTGCPHRGHIVTVGVGTNPNKASQQLSVLEVYRAMDRGVVFFTSDDLGHVALVRKFRCGCGRDTLRSAADATVNNNLDNLRVCNWQAA